jgi:hypothetical protein
MKRFIVTGLVAAAVAGFAAVSADGSSHVRIPGCGGTDHAKYEPDKVIVACGDGNFFVKDIEWTKWTRKKAHGYGKGRLNDCTPNCAQGKFHSYKVTLTATKPVTCSNGKREFSRLAWYFVHKHKGIKRSGSEHRACSS